MKTLPLLIIPLALSATLVSCKSNSDDATNAPASKKSEEAAAPKNIPMTKLTPAQFKVTPLQGYFIKNTVASEKELELQLLSTQEEFDALLGIAKTMNNEVSPLDFQKHHYIASFTKPSETATSIEITQAQINSDVITLSTQLNRGEKQSFSSRALTLFAVPKTVKIISTK